MINLKLKDGSVREIENAMPGFRNHQGYRNGAL